jgi:hypothetical protein
MIRLFLISALAIAVRAQSNEGPVEPVPPAFHCGDRDDLPMSGKDKACYWWTQSFNAGMLFGAAFNTALDPVLNGSTLKYWGQGVDGFSKRFGTRVTQSMAKGTGQALVGAIFKEDPRFYPSRKGKVLAACRIRADPHTDRQERPGTSAVFSGTGRGGILFRILRHGLDTRSTQ